jgi:hypothetical protein
MRQMEVIMKIVVVSYSFTGNNEALAASAASELKAEHIIITEPKKRTMGTIVFDMLLNRTPKVNKDPMSLKPYDFILFFGPIWMGQAATPLRPYFKYLKTYPHKYGYISISGGADIANPKIPAELKKRTGTDPAVLIDFHIADLLPKNSDSTRKDTSAYRLTESDIKKLTAELVTKLDDLKV